MTTAAAPATVASGAPPPRAIDAWVNVNMGELGRPAYVADAARDVFAGGDDYWRSYTLAETLASMDELGVERAVLSTTLVAPSRHVLSFVEAQPERFGLSLELDPRGGVPALRELAAFVAHQRVAYVRMLPFVIGRAPDDALYWPVYAKAIELGVPVAVTTGIPGPPAPAAVQDPIRLDAVCLAFPELVLVMAHGADPWWGVATRLMLKYAGLHLMTSAWLPKYLPTELIAFMNTRGRDKVVFASDHPAIPMARCLASARALPLREGVAERYLYANAAHLFFR